MNIGSSATFEPKKIEDDPTDQAVAVQPKSFNLKGLLGLFLTFVASLLYALGYFILKNMYQLYSISPAEAVFWKSLSMVFFNLVLAACFRVDPLQIPSHLVR